jgi:hypothetical protein
MKRLGSVDSHAAGSQHSTVGLLCVSMHCINVCVLRMFQHGYSMCVTAYKKCYLPTCSAS